MKLISREAYADKCYKRHAGDRMYKKHCYGHLYTKVLSFKGKFTKGSHFHRS